jgi:hypothetical protein
MPDLERFPETPVLVAGKRRSTVLAVAASGQDVPERAGRTTGERVTEVPVEGRQTPASTIALATTTSRPVE